jgi:hypothetical protein
MKKKRKNRLKKIVAVLIPLLFVFLNARGQEKDSTGFMMGVVEGEDTIIHKNIKEVVVIPAREFRNKRMERRYWRYAKKVKKVYPLALKAKKLLNEYEPIYNSMDSRRDQRRLMKNLEKQLFAEHKEELKKWSISDGRLLLKLINRETERVPYNLIRDFRGKFSAFFWQGVAKIFKNDLKAKYEPTGKDRWLEEIVTLIELGYI